MTSQAIISDESMLNEYKQIIENNLNDTITEIKKIIDCESTNEIFSIFKFDKIAKEPLTGEPENLIEVVNQSQTYLVSLKAVEYLLKKYPGTEFIVNWGNIPGYDIESKDKSIIAECFAATSYRSNSKLSKDLQRLMDNNSAEYKYEFFFDKEFDETHKAYYEKKYPGIEIVKFENI